MSYPNSGTASLKEAAHAAFLAYERMMARPIAARPINTFRTVTGLAVIGALALAGFAPTWYQVRHTH
jgi:hypothetical protein